LATASEVAGWAAGGLEGVVAEFERNFTERGDLGAAFAVVHDGEVVVDVWGGVRDGGAGLPWERDTLGPIFSGTKGLVAVCILLLVERGRLELAAPVAAYWPEFGKEHIRVQDVVAHTARLPGLDRPCGFADLLDDRRMAARLAAQAPSEDPRAGFCYHGLTFGWLCGELVRRATGSSVGAFFAREVAAPLALDLWIGLPEAEEARVSVLKLADSWPTDATLRPETLERDGLLRSIWGNPPVFDRDRFPWNRADYHAAEIPAVGGIGTARSIARLYGQLEQVLAPETVALGTATLADGFDQAHGQPRRFGVGFQLQTEGSPLGPPGDAFGHGGAGGSLHGCWPSHGIGFSYVTNLLRDDEGADSRGTVLLQALHEAVR
jgi:CubicO group peptidase (beta-lactamase class C family)